MADYALPELGGKTPLQAAKTPAMDFLASQGVLGMVSTIPDGYPPGSDVGSLSLFGFDPRRYYSGRSPLEAAALGITLKPGETAFRANLVHLKGGPFSPEGSAGSYADAIMGDFTAGHIASEEGREVIQALNGRLGTEEIRFYPGKSYRNVMLAATLFPGLETTPPHDITGKVIRDHLPRGEKASAVRELMESSVEILKDHPVNSARRSRGVLETNSLWLWGQGTSPDLPGFRERYGLSGAVISAVDLIRGIAVLLGLQVIEVPGTTGYLDTNYRGKIESAFSALREVDLVYIHVEAPDEAGHTGRLDLKMQAIEDFDREIVGRALEMSGGWEGTPRLPEGQELKLMLFIDHRTPLSLMTHSSEPVPFAAWPPQTRGGSGLPFSETSAGQSGVFIENGSDLMEFCLSI